MASILSSVTDGLKITNHEDWMIFVKRLEELVQTGKARKVTPTRKIIVVGEEWYLDPETGEIYVYVSPDPPIMPIWRKVDVFASAETPKPHP